MKISKVKKLTKSVRKNRTSGRAVKGQVPVHVSKVVDETYQNDQGTFKIGNPGRPKGCVNHRTRFINLMMETFGPDEQKKFKEFFKQSNYKFLSALDRIVTVAGISGKQAIDPEALPPFQIIIEGENDKAKT